MFIENRAIISRLVILVIPLLVMLGVIAFWDRNHDSHGSARRAAGEWTYPCSGVFWQPQPWFSRSSCQCAAPDIA